MNEGIKSWAIAASIRAIKTAAQTAIGCVGAASVLGQVDWVMVASASALAAIVSALTSVAGIPEVEGGKDLKGIVDGK